MNQISEQMGMFDAQSIDINEDVVLVEVSPTRKPKQGTTGPKQEPQNLVIAEKFEAMAETMQVQIDAKLDPNRQTNTPKRMREAGSARADGEHLSRTQCALRALSAMHEAGTVPAVLAGIKSKKALHELTRCEYLCGTGYYDAPVDTGKPRSDASEASLAVWGLLQGKSEEDKRADELRRMVEELQFCKIPGYFSTPEPVIDLMLDYAKIEPHHTILEPSAGAGAIVDRLPADNLIVVYEINPTLCKILQAKGFDARPIDFLEAGGQFAFDRVLMNPPFEKLADINHVIAGFERLKSGGRLISVMSPSAFFHSSKKAQAFRDWFEELGGEVIDLPEGSFKAAGTGVASKLIIIDKE